MAKKRRGKRLFPRRYASDFINTSRGIDQGKIAAYDIYNNRGRVASTKGPRSDMEPKLDNTWMDEVHNKWSKSNKPKTLQRYRGPEKEITKDYHADSSWKGEPVASHRHIVIIPEKNREIEDIEAQVAKVWKPTPRAKALNKIDEERAKNTRLFDVFIGDRGQKVVEYRTIILTKIEGLTIKLHFAGTQWVFEQVSKKHKFISNVYRNRDEAMLAFNTNNISWATMESL